MKSIYKTSISHPFLLLLLLAVPAQAEDELSAPTPARLRARPSSAFVAVAAHGDRMLVVDERGDVQASHDNGHTFGAARRVATAASVARGGATDDAEPEVLDDPFPLSGLFGWLGDNIWLDIGEPTHFRNATGDLFAFPYGTTGEEYLEFAPDSPAFWSPPWVQNMPKADVYYADTVIYAPEVSLGARDALVEEDAEGGAFSVALAGDGAALLGGAALFSSTDNGATWSAIAHDAVTAVSNGAALDDDGLLIIDDDRVFRGAPLANGRAVAREGDRVVVATDDAVYLSRDRGVTLAVRAAIDDATALLIAGDEVLVGSGDGLFRFREDGSLERVAEIDVAFIAAREGRVVVASSNEVFERRDGGFASIAQLDDDIIGLAVADHVLALTDSALLEIDVDTETSRERLAALQKARALSPSLDEVLVAARERFDPPSGAAAWAPRINVIGGVFAADNFGILSAVFLDQTSGDQATFVRQTAEQSTENGEKAAFERTLPYVNPFVSVFLSWDLPELLATEAPERRDDHEAWTELEASVVDTVRARERALEDLLLSSSPSEEETLHRAIALEELDARLYALSGVAFPHVGAGASDSQSDSESVERVIDLVTRNLGVDEERVARLRNGAAARWIAPNVFVAGVAVQTNNDEDDFLDEIGIELPWITKSGVSRIGLAHARLEWNLAGIWNDDPHADFIRLGRLQRAIALDAVEKYFDRRRAQAARDVLTSEELGATLSGLAGTDIDVVGRGLRAPPRRTE